MGETIVFLRDERIVGPLPRCRRGPRRVTDRSTVFFTSLGVLGRKWSLLIIRDIGWKRADRFNALLRTIPGLTPRMLALRLSELEDADMIHRVETHNSPKLVRWALTKKGEDIMPVLMRLVAFGSRWFPERIFEDERPRTLAEIYPENGGNHPWITGAPD